MSTCKITYNGNEISSAGETSPVSVTYGGNQIASVSDGESKTLNCNGLFMTGNVVAGIKTLNCENTVMVSDVAISVEPSASTGETWYFNETLSYTTSFNVQSGITTNGTHYQWLRVWSSFPLGSPTITCYSEEYPSTDVTEHIYAPKKYGWKNAAYRTIILDEPATGYLLAFLEANATKLP